MGTRQPRYTNTPKKCITCKSTVFECMARLSVAVRTYGNGDYVLSWQRIEEICMIPRHRNDIYGRKYKVWTYGNTLSGCEDVWQCVLSLRTVMATHRKYIWHITTEMTYMEIQGADVWQSGLGRMAMCFVATYRHGNAYRENTYTRTLKNASYVTENHKKQRLYVNYTSRTYGNAFWVTLYRHGNAYEWKTCDCLGYDTTTRLSMFGHVT